MKQDKKLQKIVQIIATPQIHVKVEHEPIRHLDPNFELTLLERSLIVEALIALKNHSPHGRETRIDNLIQEMLVEFRPVEKPMESKPNS